MNQISRYVQSVIDRLTNYPVLGSENTSAADKLVALLLALAPILQHYKGIVFNAGIFVLILCLPYVGLKLLLRFRSLNWKKALIALPLVLFQVFRVVAHGTSFMELAHSAVLCGYFVVIALGGINLKYVARWAYVITMAAGIGIIIQSICYYAFDFHLQLVATDLLLEESSAWVRLAQTGIIGVTGHASAFYRPSAFFLEPSHMFLYFVPTLFLLLLTREMNWTKRISAVIVSVGLLLSTSGMGIAVVVGAWLLQLGFSSGSQNILHIRHLFCKKNILRCIAFVLLFLVIATILPFLRYSILRIFLGSRVVNAMIAAEEADKASKLPPSDKEALKEQAEKEQAAAEAEKLAAENAGSTAITGRIERALSLILHQMSGQQYLIGVSDSVDDVNFNLPGFFATMYKYGIIGTVLSYVFYLCCAAFAKGATRWTAIIILGISLVSAHTHGTFYMLFYVLMLMDGIVPKPKENGETCKA